MRSMPPRANAFPAEPVQPGEAVRARRGILATVPVLASLHLAETRQFYVERLGFTSPIQAANAVFTVKRMFERFFREVVAEYAASPDGIEQEIHELHAILAGPHS